MGKFWNNIKRIFSRGWETFEDGIVWLVSCIKDKGIKLVDSFSPAPTITLDFPGQLPNNKMILIWIRFSFGTFTIGIK